MRWRSRRGMLIRGSAHSTPEFSTRGTLQEAIIVIVRLDLF